MNSQSIQKTNNSNRSANSNQNSTSNPDSALAAIPKQAQEVLEFWFGQDATKVRSDWFKKNPAFDEEIRTRFSQIYSDAKNEKLSHWRHDPFSLLALIIVVDQFPRNMFRNQPASFATDALGLKYAYEAIAKNFDKRVLPLQKLFLYLPLEHSEKMIHQKKAVELLKNLKRQIGDSTFTDYAIKHRDVIKKFGRFPHRNKVLNRKSTPQEEKWIAGGGGF